jgi:hypothetical protein
MAMDDNYLQQLTETLTKFALTKASVKALEVTGPVHEGMIYRWRIISTRHQTVTVLLKTKGMFFAKPAPKAIEIYGLNGKGKLEPTLEALQAFLDKAELVPTS